MGESWPLSSAQTQPVGLEFTGLKAKLLVRSPAVNE